MSTTKDDLWKMMDQPRESRWPNGFVADLEIYNILKEIARSSHASERQATNAINWLFRLRDFEPRGELFKTLVDLTKHSSRLVRSEAVWFVTGWSAIQGAAGHPSIPEATNEETYTAIRAATELGLEPDAELRAKSFLEHGDVLAVSMREC